jgi:hypothetical protein
LQPAYVQPVPLQPVPVLCSVSHTVPHAPQLPGEVRLLSQPSVSGGDLLQSAQPSTQPVYEQLVPPQVPPKLCVVSHATPHAPQPAAATGVSHPSVSGAVVSQSAQPGAQPE